MYITRGLRYIGFEAFEEIMIQRYAAQAAGPGGRSRPISLLRFWTSEGLTQAYF